MTVIIDYGVGNLFSLNSSFKAIGEDIVVSRDEEVIRKADRLVLPGVGAFGNAVKKLKESGLTEVIIEETAKGKPLLGICLGMQLLFEKSFEHGENEGLGLIKGEIRPIKKAIPQNYQVPHMGWNGLIFAEGKEKSPLFEGIEDGEQVYFVHSFAGFGCKDSLLAEAEYGVNITAAVGNKNIFGVQFHPEKSGKTGLKILGNFCRL